VSYHIKKKERVKTVSFLTFYRINHTIKTALKKKKLKNRLLRIVQDPGSTCPLIRISSLDNSR
jgi:hypothetical protein